MTTKSIYFMADFAPTDKRSAPAHARAHYLRSEVLGIRGRRILDRPCRPGNGRLQTPLNKFACRGNLLTGRHGVSRSLRCSTK